MRILCDFVVEVNVSGVLKQVVLPVHCLDNLGVTMPYADGNNPGKGLQDTKEAVSCAIILDRHNIAATGNAAVCLKAREVDVQI